jgi:hypothetical protein
VKPDNVENISDSKDRHDMAEILLKVALISITPPLGWHDIHICILMRVIPETRFATKQIFYLWFEK